jgi:hypothetical protein
MRVLKLARKPPTWLKAALVGLTLAFALNSIAHEAHWHDSAPKAAHSFTCGYCATFGGIHDAPATVLALVAPVASTVELGQVVYAVVVRRLQSPASPRAPPVS